MNNNAVILRQEVLLYLHRAKGKFIPCWAILTHDPHDGPALALFEDCNAKRAIVAKIFLAGVASAIRFGTTSWHHLHQDITVPTHMKEDQRVDKHLLIALLSVPTETTASSKSSVGRRRSGTASTPPPIWLCATSLGQFFEFIKMVASCLHSLNLCAPDQCPVDTKCALHNYRPKPFVPTSAWEQFWDCPTPFVPSPPLIYGGGRAAAALTQQQQQQMTVCSNNNIYSYDNNNGQQIGSIGTGGSGIGTFRSQPSLLAAATADASIHTTGSSSGSKGRMWGTRKKQQPQRPQPRTVQSYWGGSAAELAGNNQIHSMGQMVMAAEEQQIVVCQLERANELPELPLYCALERYTPVTQFAYTLKSAGRKTAKIAGKQQAKKNEKKNTAMAMVPTAKASRDESSNFGSMSSNKSKINDGGGSGTLERAKWQQQRQQQMDMMPTAAARIDEEARGRNGDDAEEQQQQQQHLHRQLLTEVATTFVKGQEEKRPMAAARRQQQPEAAINSGGQEKEQQEPAAAETDDDVAAITVIQLLDNAIEEAAATAPLDEDEDGGENGSGRDGNAAVGVPKETTTMQKMRAGYANAAVQTNETMATFQGFFWPQQQQPQYSDGNNNNNNNDDEVDGDDGIRRKMMPSPTAMPTNTPTTTTAFVMMAFPPSPMMTMAVGACDSNNNNNNKNDDAIGGGGVGMGGDEGGGYRDSKEKNEEEEEELATTQF